MRRVIHQHQVCQSRQGFAQGAQIVFGPDIAIDQYKRLLAQQRQGLEDSAPGLQRLAFGRIADLQTIATTITKIIFDLLPKPGVVDDHLLETRRLQRTQVVLDQGHPANANQWLGRVQGQGAHPLAFAGGQDHCLHAGAPAGICSEAINSPNSASSGRRATTASIYVKKRGTSVR
ncbi:hypothetical protein D3C85_1317860 [compost metagenome]